MLHPPACMLVLTKPWKNYWIQTFSMELPFLMHSKKCCKWKKICQLYCQPHNITRQAPGITFFFLNNESWKSLRKHSNSRKTSTPNLMRTRRTNFPSCNWGFFFFFGLNKTNQPFSWLLDAFPSSPCSLTVASPDCMQLVPIPSELNSALEKAAESPAWGCCLQLNQAAGRNCYIVLGIAISC